MLAIIKLHFGNDCCKSACQENKSFHIFLVSFSRKSAEHLLNDCRGLNCVPLSPHSYIEALPHSETDFGDRTFREVIKCK